MSSDAHDDGHGHHGSRFIQHHYDDAQHQFDSGKFGIWLFLAQEVLFFSALFVAYVLYRVHHGEIYSYAHKWLDVKYGAINTAVLIFSSLTAAWAVRAAQLGQKLLLIGCIVVTILCACGFLGIKYIEYSHKYHEHILFGRYFDPCISPGGAELLTKNNECKGTKSTIEWDAGTGKASEGCFEISKIDLDTHMPGIQADCKVDEVQLETYKVPILTTGGSHDCAKTPFVSIEGGPGQYTVTGACDTVIVKGGGNTIHLDTVKHLVVDGKANIVSANAADNVEILAQNPDPKAPFVPASTVTVDKGVSGPSAKKGPLAGETNADQGEKRREVKRTPIVNQCPDEQLAILMGEGEKHASEAGKAEAPKFPCWRPAYQPAVCPDLTTGEQRTHGAGAKPQAGILVEYNDHNERGETIAIKAECKAPPPPPATTETASTEEGGAKPKLGERALRPIHELTTHEEHELESLGPPPEHTNMFFTIYFAMTGLHGIHVLVGIIVFIWLLIRAVKGHFTPDYFGPIDYAALYWHIVDLIWIFLFPLLYLIH